MPIQLDSDSGEWRLQCINNHRSEGGGSSMLRPSGVFFFDLSAYVCSVCGYVELYRPKEKP